MFGRGAGLLAAFFLTITPVVVASDRTNEVDSMLMFVTLIATWAMSKAAEQNKLKWLLVAFFIVGVGFNIKMMEAFLVLPAFYLFYWISTNNRWTKKVIHLICATVVLVMVSLSWSIIVDSVPPDQRPYVGSTQDNSMVDLAIGYNGINRLVGQHGGNSRNIWTREVNRHHFKLELGERIETAVLITRLFWDNTKTVFNPSLKATGFSMVDMVKRGKQAF